MRKRLIKRTDFLTDSINLDRDNIRQSNVQTYKWLHNLYRGSCTHASQADGRSVQRYFFGVFIMDSRVDVYVREGKLIGIVEANVYGDRYIAFRGIPYAKPPVGELRFKDPVPPEPWSGDRDASQYGNIAVQKDHFTEEIVGDEDCLYLNVYTMNIKPWKKLPVMVWIHGGGFTMGSGDATFYGPDYIIRKDVVLVTLNYRLGVLGFLNLNDEVAAGNQGLKDVVMALQWVQKNIAEFGGDAGNVTIFGESAGGAIVHYLAISPLAEGLFHKAISQSGVGTCPWAFVAEDGPYSTKLGFSLAEKLGKVTEDPKVACAFLKTIDAKKLKEVEAKSLLTKIEQRQIVFPFVPSADCELPNPFFPKNPSTLIRRGVKVPYLLGHTSCEGMFFISRFFDNRGSEKILNLINSDFKNSIHPRILSKLQQISITVEELKSLYFNNKSVSEDTLLNYVNFLSDGWFYRSNMEVADIQISSGNGTTYLYKFSYENENSLMKQLLQLDVKFSGVTHGEDLFYLFFPHKMKEFGLEPPALDSKDYKIINQLTQMWTDFAKGGNPTPAITDVTPVKWTPLKYGNVYDYLNIDIEPRMETLRKGEQRWDWKNMKNKL